jgi:type I restriction enzyme R subunit
MFLTGFDATTLNTIWIDKKLRYHGLIQSFSRTNRILNSIKTYGNVICFRNLEQQVNDAVSIFGDKEAKGIVVLKTFSDYYDGYIGENGKQHPGYLDLVNRLLSDFPLGTTILGEGSEKEFIKLYGNILRLRNILQAFDDFFGKEIISAYDLQDYQSIYIGLHEKYRQTAKAEAESITDELVFEIELVKSIEVNIDYILMLVAKYHDENCQDKEIGIKVSKAIDSSPTLRNKKDLILQFINSINVDSSVYDDWNTYISTKKHEELQRIIDEESLEDEKTKQFMQEAFKIGEIRESGTAIANLLPKMSLFGKKDGSSRGEKKKVVVQKLLEFFNRFFGL